MTGDPWADSSPDDARVLRQDDAKSKRATYVPILINPTELLTSPRRARVAEREAAWSKADQTRERLYGALKCLTFTTAVIVAFTGIFILAKTYM